MENIVCTENYATKVTKKTKTKLPKYLMSWALLNHINELVNYEYRSTIYCGLVCIGVNVKIGKDILECYELCFYLFILLVLI